MFSKLAIFNLLLMTQLYIVSSFTNTFPTIKLRNNKNNLCLNMMDINRREMISLLSIPVLFNNIKLADALTKDEINQIELYDKTMPSVCYISTEYKNVSQKIETSSKIPQGVGTGYVWDTKGHIVTNFHVINNVNNATITLKNKNGIEKDYLVKLTGIDPDKDIAVLKIDVKDGDGIDLLPIPLGSNKDIKIGQNVFAIGNPFGQDFSFSMGIVSGLHRELTAPTGRKLQDMIQTDAAINPGNSGGPIIDTSGNLVGMSTSTMGMGVSSGVNFGVSVDTIKNSVSEIINNGIIKKAVLGISYLERRPTRSESEESNIPYVEKGVIVLDVPTTSSAYGVGLLGIKNVPKNTLGDVIIGIDNYEINDANDLLCVLDNYKPYDKIKLKVLRGNDAVPVTLDVILGSFNNNFFSQLEYEKI
jgi:S1-C subfamily serine protease